MRKTKEERVISRSKDVISELMNIYDDGLGVTEYLSLLDEYKKLSRRYEKTIKLSDSMGKGIIKQNTKLNDNLEYTLKTARSKLFENISEHRKTKEKSSELELKVKKYKNVISELDKKNKKLEEELKKYKKVFGEFSSQ